MIRNMKIENALIISICSMLIPMVVATRILNSSSALIPLYALGYIISFISIIRAVSIDGKIKMKYSSLNLVIFYFIILLIPILYDLFIGIKFNYFDLINIFIKGSNMFLFITVMESIKFDEESFLKVMKAIIILSLIACLFSFITEYKDILSIKGISNSNSIKIRSFFSNRNQYSAFLIVSFVANLYVSQIKKSRYCYFVYIVQIIGILTTFSRAAFFSILIIAFCMLIQSKNKSLKLLLLILIFIILIAALLGSELIQYISQNYIRMDSSADSGRFDLWNYAWNISKENLFLGVGFYTGVDIAISRGMELTQFHSMFFDTLVDGGILEVIFILYIFIFVYRKCRRCKNYKLVKVYRAALIAFIFHSTVESLSVFALSYSDMLYTIFYISIPIIISNIYNK